MNDAQAVPEPCTTLLCAAGIFFLPPFVRRRSYARTITAGDRPRVVG